MGQPHTTLQTILQFYSNGAGGLQINHLSPEFDEIQPH